MVAQLFGLVRSVGVHLDESVVALVESPGEPGKVGRAQPLLAGPVQNTDLTVIGCDLVGDGARAVR